MAPPNSRIFSVSVVLPASGCEMIAKVRRRATGFCSVLGPGDEGEAAPHIVRAGREGKCSRWQMIWSSFEPLPQSPGMRKGDAPEKTRVSLCRSLGPPSLSKSKPNISKFGAFYAKYFQRFLSPFCANTMTCKGKKEISLCSKFLRRSRPSAPVQPRLQCGSGREH